MKGKVQVPQAPRPEKTAATSAPCECCGGVMQFKYTIDRFSPPLEIEACSNCALERQANRPENPDSLYDEDYYTGRAEYSYQDERSKMEYAGYVWRARLRNINRYVPAPADFLDVGCAFGGLTAAAGEFGYRARGLDVSPFAVQEGRKQGLDLKVGALGPGIYPENSFDVVTLVEVLEHLERPREAFKTLADIVRPGGMVLLQTANYLGRQAKTAGADYHYYLPGHLYYYSTRNLERILKEHGFSRVIFFRGVDFGLLPKLRKSRGDFKSPGDYKKWLNIAWYHYKSKIALGHFALTSSMTAYAFKD